MCDNVEETKSPEECCNGFDFEQAQQAISALQAYAQSSSDAEKDLFSDDRSIYLEVVMKKYPVHLPPVKFLEILLPHPFHDPSKASSCIIVRDLDKRPSRQDTEKSSRIYKDFFAEMQGLTEATEVISVKQLLSDYKTYEAKRKLCHSYDVFMADARLGGHITKWLGKEFVQSKKVPFFINVTKRVKKNFGRVFALSRALLTPSTLKFTIKIGRLNQPPDHLLENLKAIMKELSSNTPGSWVNVRSAYISLPSVLDLPVYVDWGSSNAVKLPKPMKQEPTCVEGELTTLNSKDEDDETPPVHVYSDGTVIIGKADKKRTQPVTHWNPPKKRFLIGKGSKSRGIGGRRARAAKMKTEMKAEDDFETRSGAKVRRISASES